MNSDQKCCFYLAVVTGSIFGAVFGTAVARWIFS